MSLLSINIDDFRNLSQIKLDLSNQCNIFYGENGSGKTSVLEAIHYLVLGRSFRSHILRRIIKYDSKSFSIFGKIKQENSTISAGISKSTETGKSIRINGKNVSSSIEITRLLPLQLLNHDSYSLLYGGPKIRRQFIDKGLFHVKHSFLDLWRRVDRILTQRNIAIRKRLKLSDIKIWDKSLTQSGYELHLSRKKYIEDFLPIANGVLQNFLPNFSINLSYLAGWDTEMELEDALSKNITRDLQLGYTCQGPHRADIQIFSGKTPAKDSLSRGQQKLLVYGLQIAQGLMITKLANKKCLYLIDDLLAELDSKRSELLAKMLIDLQQSQIFVTGLVHKELEQTFCSSDKRIFCLKNGVVE